MGRAKPGPQAAVTPVESTVTPVQTINPEGHTGNAWVQKSTQPTQPTQAPGQESGGLLDRNNFNQRGGENNQQFRRRLHRLQGMRRKAGIRPGEFGRPAGQGQPSSVSTLQSAPGQLNPIGGGFTQGGTAPMSNPVTPGVTRLPKPTTY